MRAPGDELLSRVSCAQPSSPSRVLAQAPASLGLCSVLGPSRLPPVLTPAADGLEGRGHGKGRLHALLKDRPSDRLHRL